MSSRSFRSTLVILLKRKGEEICVFVVYFTKSLPLQNFQNLLQYLVLILLSCRQESRLELIPRTRLHRSKINLVFALLFYVFKIHFIIIFLNTRRFSKWPLVVRFPHQNLVYNSYLPQSWSDHLNNLVHDLSRSRWILRYFPYHAS